MSTNTHMLNVHIKTLETELHNAKQLFDNRMSRFDLSQSDKLQSWQTFLLTLYPVSCDLQSAYDQRQQIIDERIAWEQLVIDKNRGAA